MTIACAGEILFDDIETAQQSNDNSLVTERHRFIGGAPANVAVGIRRYGVPTSFIGGISTDAAGDACVRALSDAGISIDGVQRIADAPTRFVHVRQDLNGDREFVDFFGRDPGDFADAHFLAEQLQYDPSNTKLLVMGTLGFAYPKSRAALQLVLEHSRHANVPVFIDVNRRPMFWPTEARHNEFELTRQAVDCATYIKLENAEAQWLFGTTDPAAIIDANPHIQGVVLTHGARDIHYRFHGSGSIYRPPTVAAVDTTGAGDGFVAGLLAYWCRVGFDPAQIDMAIGYGATAGALTTLGLGAQDALPNAAQIEAASGFILP